MKKVLCFIDSLGSGGAQRQMAGLATLLHEKGYNVKVVTYYDMSFYQSYIEQENIDYECLNSGRNIIKRFIGVVGAIKRFKPDIVISYLDTPNIIACACKIFPGSWRLIVSERSLTQNVGIRERVKFVLYRKADIIVSNSYSQNNYIIKHYPELSSKCKVVTNFVDTEQFSPPIEKSSNNPIRLIGVGRINDEKNIPLLINAINILNEKGYRVKVDWYGKKYPIYELCSNLVNKLNMEDTFKFHEPSLEIVKEYQTSDIFVLTSFYEGFSNVICEAMSCGLPIIASDVSDNGVLVKDGINGFVFPSNDKDKLADCIIRYLNLSEEQKTVMGKKSRERALSMFSPVSFVEKYIQLFD